MRRCVVWDVDDTLYLERDYARSGFAAVGRWLAAQPAGIEGFGPVAWQLFEAGVRGTIFNGALERLGVDPAMPLIRSLVSVYREHDPEISLLPDAARAIELLAQSKVPMAAITDGPVASQRAKVRALGVADFATPCILTGELGEGFGKPNPRAFEAVMAHHDLDGPACTYIADNPAKDFVAPRALGWHTIRVRRPGGLHVDVTGGDDIAQVVASLDEIDWLLP